MKAAAAAWDEQMVLRTRTKASWPLVLGGFGGGWKLSCRVQTKIPAWLLLFNDVMSRARAKLVYACEWNPHAVEALKA
ncbi:unnamed protein product [Dovyalis caffra]|uniref:Uncharacterized protein n=1 Tax=Dovyalis caffra TaxID=77055 RepID=A0AAV1SW24_9ROSI|nr:unnamed protein product [Dovyalis caffra]